MSDEPRVTPPGDTAPDEAEEATVAMPAADAEEATVAMPATDAEEATVTMAATDAGEATVTMPAADAEEATVAMPTTDAEEATVTMAATDAEEATVAMTAAKAPDDEQTITLTAADLTVALAAEKPAAAPAADEMTVALPAQRTPAEATMVVVPQQYAPPPRTEAPAGGFLTRRRLLLGLSGAAGTALAVAAVATHSRSANDAGKGAATPIPSRSTVVRSREPESTAVTTPPVATLHKPISTLAEYAKAAGLPAFPSDAIALTIDDGPHPVWTPKILQLLDKYQVPALFCMIGNQVLGHETVAQQVTGAGHQLANHTWSHPTKLGTKPAALVQKEIHRAQAKINKTTGYVPKLFRSPGGDWSPKLLHTIAQAGLLPLDWSNDPRDWSRPGVPKIENRMLAAHPGQILLCHDGGGDRSQTYQALRVVLPALKARGLQFVAL
ncbi:polysaccharide deacetylase family protein [Actinoplanes oblitus]|uniref:Polysaccharide deacetylase family protein n=1 Tax=Actinoplanes oblitus TaxID=3040509 RepID=A0ABY8WNY3_9ACTN|nr:polysaccharide deacetylase family protein [Actinoplanes oblitus]WIM98585.1 polysaccharide deacetylase family protein [Actinoplanes oblitus]